MWSRIQADGKRIDLGYFSSEEMAHIAYENAKKDMVERT